MQGVVYQPTVASYLASRAASRWWPGLLASGRVPGLALRELPNPELPGPDWLRLRPRLAGVCGTDLAALTARASPALSPFASFPAVLGHEVVAEVVAVGATVEDVAPGERIAVDPVISCFARGLEACPFCRRGDARLCVRTTEGPLAPGMAIGFCRDLPGGWSDSMVVHRSQVHRVPPEVDDTLAVLVEPLSVALHAVLKLPPERDSSVLVVGAGSMGLCVVAALRLLERPCRVTVVARHPFQATLAEKLGAAEVLLERGGAQRGAGRAAVEIAGARRYQPPLGDPVYAGGFDWVYDCVGSARSLDDSLRVAGPSGRLIVVGCPGEIAKLDWSFVWARELHVLGSYVYGTEPSWPGAPHTFEIAVQLLAEHPGHPLGELVTHHLPLSAWRKAIALNLQRRSSPAIKTVLFPSAVARDVPD